MDFTRAPKKAINFFMVLNFRWVYLLPDRHSLCEVTGFQFFKKYCLDSIFRRIRGFSFHKPDYPTDRELKHVYVAAALNAAVLGAALAPGEGRERIYLVEATGPVEDDPNVTDKKFPGNPTLSYRSTHPFKVIGEVTIWQKHSPEQIQAMKDGLKRLKEQGLDVIEE